MPGGDGTGPRGMGSMTGRGAGYCRGYGQPGFANAVPGGFGSWGRGRGGGGGRGTYGRGGGGWRHRHWAAGPYGWGGAGRVPATGFPSFGSGMSREDEVAMLKQQAQAFQQSMEDILKRIQELETEKPENT